MIKKYTLSLILVLIFTNSVFCMERQESGDLRQRLGSDQVSQKLDSIKDVMAENLSLVKERGQNLDSIVNKTEDLNASSKKFEQRIQDLVMLQQNGNQFVKELSLFGLGIIVGAAIVTWVPKKN